MQRKFLVAVAGAIAGVLSALAAPSDKTERNANARAALVKGVSAIDCGGGALPGPFVCLTDDAFPVVAARNYDGTIHPVVVGAFHGDGRVLALGHPAFLSSKATIAETAQFLRNAADWLRGEKGKASPVAVVGSDAILANLKACGVASEKVASFADAAKFHAVAISSGDVKSADIPAIQAYVKKGGGLLTDALTWGWIYYAERTTGQTSPALHYDLEKLVAPFGFVAGDMGVNRTGKGVFETSVAFPRGTSLPEALAAVRDGSAASNATLRAQVAKTLVQAATACPPSAKEPFAALAALVDDPAAQKRPSFAAPLKSADYLARVATVMRQNAWQHDPARVWPADPAAAAYPGLVASNAAVVADAQVPLDLSVTRWHSTGLFAGAGAPIVVRLPKGAETLGLKLRVGTTGDDLTACDEWKRAPLVTVTIPLDRPELKFATPFGGLLYVVVPEGLAGRQTSVSISGAVRAARFVLGRDTNADWRKMLAECPAPQAEIEGEHYVITLMKSRAAEATDPEWIAKFWDKVVRADAELTGYAAPRSYKERICADVQLKSGWLHDGYPMMYHSVAKNPESIVRRADIEKTGEWGVLHELGHNFQNRDWTFPGTGEVTVNLFTLYSAEKALGLSDRERFGDNTSRAACRRRAVRWVEDGKDFEAWKRDYFLALDTFMRIQRVFGWQPFVTMFREYRAPVVGTLPRNPQEQLDQWATRLSRILDRNFADYFKAWSWPLSADAVAACAKHPKFDAKESATLFEDLAGLPEDAVVALKVTPRDGAIANVGGWTSFVFAMEPEARDRALWHNLKCTGRYRLRVAITDETDGQTREFDYPIRDINKDLWPVARIAPIPFGVRPQKGRAYTVAVKVLEGEKLRFAGASAKGAFVSSDAAFLLDGPIHFAPTVKVHPRPALRGKSVLFVGDSITEAICEVNTPRLRYTAGWPGRVGWANEMRWLNTGISGATVSNNWGPGNTVRNQVGWHKGMPFDLVIAHGGINDAMGKCPAGTIAPGGPEDYNPSAEDFKTFAGSLEYLFWQIRTQIPTAKVGYIINFKVKPSGWSDWAKMPEYLPLMKAACKKWQIPYLDLWEDDSVTAQMKPETRMALGDSLHPNDLGYDILYPYVEQFVEAVATGAAKPGEEFKAKPVVFKDPVAQATITSNDVNVAAGKMCRNGMGWNDGMTNGKLDGYILTGNTTSLDELEKSQCYHEIDLGALYTIDKLRVFPFLSNGVSLWAAFATDDASKPLRDWKRLYVKNDTRMSNGIGYAVAFAPTDAQFVRVYGFHEVGQNNALFIEAEVFGKLSAKNKLPLKSADVPAGLVDVAKDAAWTRAGEIWCEDGEGECVRSLGTKSDCFVEVDLGRSCEISALRAAFAWGIRGHWEAFATDDATQPVDAWTKLGEKKAVYPGDEKGFTIAFRSTHARYVRVYGVRSWGRANLPLEKPQVFGRVLDEIATPAHTLMTKPDWRWDGGEHFIPCRDPKCPAHVRAAKHVYRGAKELKASEGGQPGEIVRKCLFCGYEPHERGVRGTDVNLALGRPAKFADGRPAPWMTDGLRVPKGYEAFAANAKPLAQIAESTCYFEIDLGASYTLTDVNFVDDLQNLRNTFAVYVSDDAAAPIGQWTLAGTKLDGKIARYEGHSIRFAKPAKGRYVRVYALRQNFAISEIAIYGRK